MLIDVNFEYFVIEFVQATCRINAESKKRWLAGEEVLIMSTKRKRPHWYHVQCEQCNSDMTTKVLILKEHIFSVQYSVREKLQPHSPPPSNLKRPYPDAQENLQIEPNQGYNNTNS